MKQNGTHALLPSSLTGHTTCVYN